MQYNNDNNSNNNNTPNKNCTYNIKMLMYLMFVSRRNNG